MEEEGAGERRERKRGEKGRRNNVASLMTVEDHTEPNSGLQGRSECGKLTVRFDKSLVLYQLPSRHCKKKRRLFYQKQFFRGGVLFTVLNFQRLSRQF